MHISVLMIHILFFLNSIQASTIETPIVIEKPQTQQQLALAIVHSDNDAQNAAQEIKKILDSTGLFKTVLQQDPFPQNRKKITDYLSHGFGIVLFLEHHEGIIKWRLYDTTDAQMLRGKTSSSDSMNLTIRLVADAVYSYLFNTDSYFLTQIACIKKNPNMRNKRRTELCIIDPVSGAQRTIVRDNRILVAPQWGKMTSGKKVWLNVSEFTPSNARLLGVDLHGYIWSIIDLPGTCVGTAQYNDGKFVYVHSGALWLYEFDSLKRKGSHRRLTDGLKIAACPSLLKSGDIIYSCNGSICRYDMAAQQSSTLPIGGNCLAPDVHGPTGNLIFSRSVNGILQLHSSDSQGNTVKQLTYGSGNKVDACWSPCGNYIAYTRSEKGREQIAIYNCMNKQEIILTPADQNCGYPSWSEPSMELYS